MIKIAHKGEVTKHNLPEEVAIVIEEIATILDREYGECRDIEDGDGGYILVIEDEAELEQLKEIYLDVDDVIPEFVDLIEVQGEEKYSNTLILMTNEFGISLFMKEELLSDNLKEYIND